MLDAQSMLAEGAPSPSTLSFGALDWGVVLGVLLATSLFGAWFGRQSTLRDFFLGGRRLPWWAVSASIVATEISALTLVSLPAIVFVDGGTCAYLQITLIGSVVARLAIAWWLVPAYYQEEIYSPYDWVGRRLGESARRMMTLFGAIGGVLSQAARVYLTAVVLEILLHEQLRAWEDASGIPSIGISILLITSFAVAWTWVGGIVTVVWTDLLLFFVFCASAATVVLWIAGNLDGGLMAIIEHGRESGRARILDFDTSPVKAYTFWAALFGAGFGNIGAYGVDQLMAQRILCCRGVREARLAVSFSIVAVLVGLLVAWSGIALAAWYDAHPLDGEAWRLVSERTDRILPVFTASVLPEGLRGFVVAGVFAAAISSLDGVLAALAQTTMHAWWLPRRQRRVAAMEVAARPTESSEERRSIAVSRRLVVAYGALMVAVAWAMDPISRAYASLLDLGLAMAGYTQGALLAAFLLALLRPSVGASGWVWGAPASLLLVFGVAWHGPGPQVALALASVALLVAWFAFGRAGRRRGATLALVAVLGLASWSCAHAWTSTPSGTLQSLAWPWYVPLGCAASIVLGLLLARVDEADARDFQA